ncbi:MAG: DegV family protein [Chloroflexota bacterium]
MNENKIAILTDSSTHIPESIRKGLSISVIPVWLLWDNERFRDGVDIDLPTFYRRLKESKTLPTTSQPTPGEFIEHFKQLAQNAAGVVGVLVSSKISGTVSSALAAREQLSNLSIKIVDSLQGSMGAGFMVLAAARAAAAGKPIKEIVAAAEELREKIHFLFMVDTLEYLHKGGRIGTAKRLLGTALSIKPILQFKEGLIQPLSQARTKSKALAEILHIAEQRLGGKKMAEAAVVDIDAPREGDTFAEMVKQRFNPLNLYRSPVSPVVGSHIGPGALGLAFYPE